MDITVTRIKPTVVALLYALATFSPAAGSAVLGDLPPMDGLQNAEEVSDEILGNRRGKFVGGGKIVNFGVQMVSTWQNVQGQILSAAANLNVNIANATQPVVQFVPHLTIVEATRRGASADHNYRPNCHRQRRQQLNGVAQSIQIAGDGNRIGNDASISISSGPPPALPSGPATTGPQTASLTSSSGATVSASVQGNGIAVGITVPSIGQALQQIKGHGGKRRRRGTDGAGCREHAGGYRIA
ncbi:MAG: hypothetical protein M5R42_14580 [Rhodocyclaceae bacterium]|nr:hypothetical protein [Rhodocyclaceae bacterium]